MRLRGKVLVCVLTGLIAGTGARAVPSASRNPYDTIPQRNVFNLRKEEPRIEEPAGPPLPKITLTGITTLLGLKRAVLQVQAPARPGAPAGDQSLILAEGQRDGDIEVLEIDETAGMVKIQTAGMPVTLDFVNNGAKPPTLPAQPAIPPTGGAAAANQRTQSVSTPNPPPSGAIPAPQPTQTAPQPVQPSLVPQ
jgi:hypothetical protein